MRIRKYKASDIPAISRLFYETVHGSNSSDYGARQIEAWAPRVYPDAIWKQRFRGFRVYVAEDKGTIAGFATLDNTGYIDCFYVHHRWQGKGMGTRLLKSLEAAARKNRIKRLQADVSITAMPFFRKAGFREVRQQKKIYRNCSFRQYVMKKAL